MLKPSIYTEQHFVLIDNKVRYNIGALIELLKAKSDPTKPQARITMNSHKLHYYLSSAKQLRIFFADFLDDKLRELNKIVLTARINIDTYNENVRISNNELTRIWIEQHKAVNAAREAATSKLDISDGPSDQAADISIKTTDIDLDLAKQARFTALSIGRKAKSTLSRRIHDHLSEMQARDARTPFESLSTSGYRIQPPHIKLDLDASTVTSRPTIAAYWSQLRQRKLAALQTKSRRLGRILNQLEKLLQSRSPLLECEKQVNDARASLTVDLDKFFRNVELYRDGVFSIQTKESISTLGIGGQLDALESEFSDKDKIGFVNQTMIALFPNFYEVSAKTQTRLISIEQLLRPLLGKYAVLSLPEPDLSPQQIDLPCDDEARLLVDKISNDVQKDVEEFCDQLSLSLSAHLVASLRLFDGEIASARRQRRNRYISLFLFVGFLGLSIYVGYNVLVQKITDNFFEVIMGGVLSHLVFDCIGGAFAWIFDKFPHKVRQIREQFELVFRKEVLDIMDREFDAYRFAIVDEVNLAVRLEQVWRRIMASDADAWHKKATDYLIALHEISTAADDVRGGYLSSVDEITGTVATYFSDAVRNLDILSAVADEIK